MLWAMFCWESLGPAIYQFLTSTDTRVETVFSYSSGLFQQDNASCHAVNMLQQWFEEHNQEFKVVTWPRNSPDLNPIISVGRARQTCLIHGDPMSQLMPQMCQSSFSSKWGTCTILRRWSIHIKNMHTNVVTAQFAETMPRMLLIKKLHV